MRIDILTLFPESVGDMLSESILGRAAERGFIRIECHQIRDYTKNRQKQVDDYPYGGGFGLIMQVDPLYNCWQAVCGAVGSRPRTILMSPCGERFSQAHAKRLAGSYDSLILVCGHYEGVDQRFIDHCVDEEISLGDFVLTGGEIPAMAVADAVCRLTPGVLRTEECYIGESHWDGLLEYPQYTRPEIWQERPVPPVLLSGHHANIEQWRKKESLIRTMRRRPDMLASRTLSEDESRLLNEIRRDGGGSV